MKDFQKMKRAFCILLTAMAVAISCEKPEDPGIEPIIPPDPEPVFYSVKPLAEMSLREKIGLLFFVRAEALSDETKVTVFSKVIEEYYAKYPVGGFTLFAQNIVGPSQLDSFTKKLHDLANYPLLSIDEEGGTVARIAKNGNFGVPAYSSMYDIGSTGDSRNAYEAGNTIGSYIKSYGFDIDFAPVADVFTNPKNTVIGKRSFSSNPRVAAEMSSQFLLGLQKEGVEGCLKHFPGHGDTSTDSHYGYAETKKTWEEMLACEMIPFKEGIKNGAQLIMTAHVGTPNVTGNATPASLSHFMLTEKLRGELGYKNIIITDAIEMGAITNEYSVEEATVKALQAGADIVLMPSDLEKAFNAVEKAIEDGTLTEERIDESASRVIELKKRILSARGQLDSRTSRE